MSPFKADGGSNGAERPGRRGWRRRRSDDAGRANRQGQAAVPPASEAQTAQGPGDDTGGPSEMERRAQAWLDQQRAALPTQRAASVGPSPWGPDEPSNEVLVEWRVAEALSMRDGDSLDPRLLPLLRAAAGPAVDRPGEASALLGLFTHDVDGLMHDLLAVTAAHGEFALPLQRDGEGRVDLGLLREAISARVDHANDRIPRNLRELEQGGARLTTDLASLVSLYLAQALVEPAATAGAAAGARLSVPSKRTPPRDFDPLVDRWVGRLAEALDDCLHRFAEAGAPLDAPLAMAQLRTEVRGLLREWEVGSGFHPSYQLKPGGVDAELEVERARLRDYIALLGEDEQGKIALPNLLSPEERRAELASYQVAPAPRPSGWRRLVPGSAPRPVIAPNLRIDLAANARGMAHRVLELSDVSFVQEMDRLVFLPRTWSADGNPLSGHPFRNGMEDLVELALSWGVVTVYQGHSSPRADGRTLVVDHQTILAGRPSTQVWELLGAMIGNQMAQQAAFEQRLLEQRDSAILDQARALLASTGIPFIWKPVAGQPGEIRIDRTNPHPQPLELLALLQSQLTGKPVIYRGGPFALLTDDGLEISNDAMRALRPLEGELRLLAQAIGQPELADHFSRLADPHLLAPYDRVSYYDSGAPLLWNFPTLLEAPDDGYSY